ELAEIALVQLRAMGEIGNTWKWRVGARSNKALCAGFGQSTDDAKTQPARRLVPCCAGFERAIPHAHRDIDRSYFDAMTARIRNELRRRVETHRLRVQK